eukprot:TRINITY_DN114752_c0_g1_i1.p1 TRINITY_DN114752_c0_g1~~TRINITY_DN114752_c0_g1_i1.p1  ORF type:complete len:235 (-),score=68.22 TRINITY_DN114752_c0_g1_i1:85-789(-)
MFMDPEEPCVTEFIKGKQGAELFRELFRHLPVASYEDYYRNGIWQDELMKLDIQMVVAHKKEAGAPDPPPLDEVKLPPGCPTGGAVAPGGMSVMAGMIRALSGSAAAANAAANAALAAPPGTGIPNGAATPANPPLDIKTIALFVSKWKLDPNRCKAALEKLTPARRKYVMQNFKETDLAASSDKLEEYIATCEKENSWASADAAAAGATNGQVKRPLEGSTEDEANKKAKTDA